MTARTIFIRPEAFGAYDIVVEPAPDWANHNAQRPTHREARRYAESLKIVHGWRIDDQTREGA